MELLHDFGIVHGQLDGTKTDNRYILLDIDLLSKEDRLVGKARRMIVDFSTAAHHICKRSVPLVDMDVNIYPSSDAGCDEIVCVATTLGMSGREKHIDMLSSRVRHIFPDDFFNFQSRILNGKRPKSTDRWSGFTSIPTDTMI